jgi:hypothetical protein
MVGVSMLTGALIKEKGQKGEKMREREIKRERERLGVCLRVYIYVRV